MNLQLNHRALSFCVASSDHCCGLQRICVSFHVVSMILAPYFTPSVQQWCLCILLLEAIWTCWDKKVLAKVTEIYEWSKSAIWMQLYTWEIILWSVYWIACICSYHMLKLQEGLHSLIVLSPSMATAILSNTKVLVVAETGHTPFWVGSPCHHCLGYIIMT